MKFLFLIPFFLFAQIEPDSIKILLTFSEAMDSTELFSTNNYQVIGNSGDTLIIYAIGKIQNEDNNDSVVVLVSKHSYNSNYYTVYVDSVYDLVGNKINAVKNFAFYDYGLGNIKMVDSIKIR